MPFTKRRVKKYYSNLFEGKIAEAERILQRISTDAKTEEEKNYAEALQGIHYAYSAADEEAFITRLFRSEENLRKRKKFIESLTQAASRPMVDSRKGFYDAWIDLLSMARDLPTPHRFRREREREEAAPSSEEEQIVEKGPEST